MALSRDLVGAVAPKSQGGAGGDPFEVVVHRRYNPEAITAYNIVPGLLGVILSMTLVMMTALGVTREYERGTMESLLATPGPADRGDDRQAGAVCGRRPRADGGDPDPGADPVRGADGRRLASPVPGRPAVHRRLAGPGLSDLDRDPHPAAGDANVVLLHDALDPAVGVHVPVPGMPARAQAVGGVIPVTHSWAGGARRLLKGLDVTQLMAKSPRRWGCSCWWSRAWRWRAIEPRWTR
ncbi:hypothetical protein ACRAWD_24125 [Caulobacter segnis]